MFLDRESFPVCMQKLAAESQLLLVLSHVTMNFQERALLLCFNTNHTRTGIILYFISFLGKYLI